VFFQSENGLIGTGPIPEGAMAQPRLTDAGGRPVTAIPGACTFDSAMSFGLIRGGHLDVTVLGGLQLDERGLLANWTIPGKMVPGMGGAMDLVTGAKRVIVAMEHAAKGGAPKILDRCKLPLTGKKCVNTIITDMAYMEVTPQGLLLKEVASGHTAEDVQKITGARLRVSPELRTMAV